MEQEDKSHQWNIAWFGLFAVIIGGLIGFGGSWYLWNLQQETSNEQKFLEQQNIAHAIYIDVSNIELNLNDSLEGEPYNMSRHDDLTYISSYINNYYNDNWLYPVFGKAIAELDNVTAENVYNFYYLISEAESRRRFVVAISEKQQKGEKITPYEAILAYEYTNALYTIILPTCILQAEKIKQDLRLVYNVRVESPLTIVHSASRRVINLNGVNLILP